MAAASESLTYALFFKVRNPFPETRGPAAMKPGLGRLPQGDLARGGELSGLGSGAHHILHDELGGDALNFVHGVRGHVGAARVVLAGHQQLVVLLVGCGETTGRAERSA